MQYASIKAHFMAKLSIAAFIYAAIIFCFRVDLQNHNDQVGSFFLGSFGGAALWFSLVIIPLSLVKNRFIAISGFVAASILSVVLYYVAAAPLTEFVLSWDRLTWFLFSAGVMLFTMGGLPSMLLPDFMKLTPNPNPECAM